MRHCDIQLGWGDIAGRFNRLDWGPQDDTDNPNTNIGEKDGTDGTTDDPLFVDDTALPVSDRDYRISMTSKCIDAASNLRVPADAIDLDGDGNTLERVPVDLAGVTRFWDDPATEPDPGEDDQPDYPDVTDMGAYELICSIASIDPPDGAIDARQPTSLDGSVVYGWDEVTFTVELGVAAPLTVDSVTVNSTSGIPPGVQSVTVDGNVVTVTLDGPIPPGAWTRITLAATDLCSSMSACLGYLPGDVSGDGTSTPDDILAVIDALNGVVPRPIYATDADRSGVAGPEDILRVIDLLNGAAAFDVWLDVTIGGTCPIVISGGSPPDPELPIQAPPPAVFFVEGALAYDYLDMLTDSQWSPLFDDGDIAATVLVTTQSVATELPDELINMAVSVLEDPTTAYSHPVVANLIPNLIIILNTHNGGAPIPNP